MLTFSDSLENLISGFQLESDLCNQLLVIILSVHMTCYQ